MALQTSGTISLANVRTELDATGAISLGGSAVRDLAGIPSGVISLSDLYGASDVLIGLLTTQTGDVGIQGSGFTTKYGFGSLTERSTLLPGHSVDEFYFVGSMTLVIVLSGNTLGKINSFFLDGYGISPSELVVTYNPSSHPGKTKYSFYKYSGAPVPANFGRWVDRLNPESEGNVYEVQFTLT